MRDQQGAPIANAQVIIVGTKFGAQSNADGYYFINNCPGRHGQLEASFIGYKKTRVTDIRITSGQTITADVTLESTPVASGPKSRSSRRRTSWCPETRSPRSRPSTATTPTSCPWTASPTSSPCSRASWRAPSGNTLSIRGGRTDEDAVYVDGVPVGAGNRGSGSGNRTGRAAASTIGTNAFEDASVTTGAASAAVRRRPVGHRVHLDPHRRLEVHRRPRV